MLVVVGCLFPDFGKFTLVIDREMCKLRIELVQAFRPRTTVVFVNQLAFQYMAGDLDREILPHAMTKIA